MLVEAGAPVDAAAAPSGLLAPVPPLGLTMLRLLRNNRLEVVLPDFLDPDEDPDDEAVESLLLWPPGVVDFLPLPAAP